MSDDDLTISIEALKEGG